MVRTLIFSIQKFSQKKPKHTSFKINFKMKLGDLLEVLIWE